MYHRLSDDMDINCGAVIDEGLSIAEMGERIFNRVLEVTRATVEKRGPGPWRP